MVAHSRGSATCQGKTYAVGSMLCKTSGGATVTQAAGEVCKSKCGMPEYCATTVIFWTLSSVEEGHRGGNISCFLV